MADSYQVKVVIAGQNNLSQPVGQATQSLRQLNQEASRTNQAFSQLKTVGMGLFAGASLAGVARMAEDLYQTGMNAQRAEMLFRSFGAQVGDTTALLERLRVTSRGVVTDVDLMNSASSFLSMGLAKNADEVNRLTDVAVTFAQAMGTDVASSISNLSALLSNQSLLRLDTLGISSAQVRELWNQYKAAGVESSEAFTQAFLEVAEGKLPQMAQVADATVTEFQKLSTAMDNWWTDFGERFAQGVNGLIGIAQNAGPIIQAALFGQTSVQGQAAADATPGISAIAAAQAAQYATVEYGGMPGYGPGSQGRSEVTARAEAYISRLLGYAQNTGANIADLSLSDVRNAAGMSFATLDNEVRAMREWAAGAQESMRQSALWAQQNAELEASLNQVTQAVETGFSIVPAALDPMAAQRGEAMGGANVWLQAIRAQMAKNQSPFMTRQDAYSVGEAAEEVQRLVDEALRLNEINPGFLSEQNVGLLSSMADEAARTAAAADSMASAFERASLSQLFGQTSGGRLGEIDAAVIDSLRAGGASEDTISALIRAMGLDSGQLTQMSVQFEEQVVPFLEDVASQMGADAYNAMRRKYDEAVAGAAMTGAPAIDMASLMGGFAYYPGGGGPAGSYTVRPGDTASGIAAQYGVSVSDFGLANPSLILPGQQLTWGSAGGGGLINTDFDMLEQSMMQAEVSVANAATSASTIADEMTTAVDTLATGLDGVFSKTYQLPIELVVSGAGILGQLIAAAVQANGGVAPGTSANTGRSNTGTRGDGTYSRGR